MQTLRTRRIAAVCSFVVTGLAAGAAAERARAADSVDLELAGAAIVDGTIRDAGERETFVVDAPAGTVCKASAKARGKLAPVPRLALVDESGGELAAGAARGRGATLALSALEDSAPLRIRVSGDGIRDGDYRLKVGVKHRRKWPGQGVAAAAQQGSVAGFSAPAGATAAVVVRPASGSGFVPSLVRMTGPEGFETALPGGGTAGPVLLGATGDYTIHFDDAGSEGGAWTCSVVVTPREVGRSVIDIRGQALTGDFVDGQPVYGRVVGETGGIVDPPDDGLGLDGCSIEIPGGALPSATVISIAETSPYVVASGVNAVGPAVKFGPDGTTFGQSATIRLAFDADLVPDTDLLTIYVRNDLTGAVEAVAKPYDFPEPGVVSFPALHFSTYMATTTGPRGLSGTFRFVRMAGFAGNERSGATSVAQGAMTFSGSGHSLTGSEVGAYWSAPASQSPAVTPFAGPLSVEGALTVLDDSTIDLSIGSDVPFVTLRRGASPDALAATEVFETAFGYANAVYIAARAARGAPTRTNLAGDWHMTLVSAGASSRTDMSGTRVRLHTQSVDGDATFGADGAVVCRLGAMDEFDASYPDGTWGSNAPGEGPAARGVVPGTLDISSGAAMLTLDSGDPVPMTVRLDVVLDGDMLLGAFGGVSSGSDEPGVMVFVRKSKTAPASVLSAASTGARFSAERVDGTTGVPTVNFRAAQIEADRTTSPAGWSLVGGTIVQHGATGSAFGDEIPGESLPVAETLAADGKFTTDLGFRGAATRRGAIVVGSWNGSWSGTSSEGPDTGLAVLLPLASPSR